MSEFAFENYGQLKSAVAEWLMRQDLEPQIPVWIKMVEAFCDRELRTREMIKRSRTQATGQYIALPDDWRKAKNIQRMADQKALGLMAFDEIDRYREALRSGRVTRPGAPTHYALVGNTLELAPSPTPEDPVEIEMIYYAQVPRLEEAEAEGAVVEGVNTNWLLRGYPDIYLYGALVHSAPYLKDDERVGVWEKLFKEAVIAANGSDADSRFSGAPMVRRGKGFGV